MATQVSDLGMTIMSTMLYLRCCDRCIAVLIETGVSLPPGRLRLSGSTHHTFQVLLRLIICYDAR